MNALDATAEAENPQHHNKSARIKSVPPVMFPEIPSGGFCMSISPCAMSWIRANIHSNHKTPVRHRPPKVSRFRPGLGVPKRSQDLRDLAHAWITNRLLVRNDARWSYEFAVLGDAPSLQNFTLTSGISVRILSLSPNCVFKITDILKKKTELS
jgi:hypothetical protein